MPNISDRTLKDTFDIVGPTTIFSMALIVGSKIANSSIQEELGYQFLVAVTAIGAVTSVGIGRVLKDRGLFCDRQ